MTEKPLKIALALGIGDCHWALTKLRALRALHPGRPVHAYVNSSPNHATWGYLGIVPFIDRAEYSPNAPYDVWNDLAGTHRHPRWSALEGCRNWRNFDYVLVPNGHLERGERLETWLPELDTEFSYPLDIPAEVRESEVVQALRKRVLLYPSGIGPNLGFHANTWTVYDWIQVIRLFNADGFRPALVGANTADDIGYAAQIEQAAFGASYDNFVGQTSIPEYCAAIEEAKVWVGLNSGGGIVSAMRGTPTVMLWSNAEYPVAGVNPRNVLHPNMRTSWLSEQQLTTYRTLSFGSPELTPREVVLRALEVLR